jgi:two-component sensor histidine kinase
MMTDSVSSQKSIFPSLWSGAVWRDAPEQRERDLLTVQLRAALAREQAWLHERSDLLQRQEMLAQEFDHRLVNSLQIIVSLLSLQSRAATAEAAAQLTAAAHRVSSFGRVHRALHLLDHQESVEFKEYLQHLCRDLSGLLFQGETERSIVVEGAKIYIPTAFAIPLGFVVNELITNSAKYASGNIILRLGTTPPAGHSISVTDDGPGLPAGFDPAGTKSLGMKIISSLVRQIGGKLQTAAGENGRGARFTVTFYCPRSVINGAHLTGQSATAEQLEFRELM